MAINRISITSQPITQNTDVSIQMLTNRPNTKEYLADPVTPNTMVGWYNYNSDTVELYVTDPTGRRYVKVR